MHYKMWGYEKMSENKSVSPLKAMAKFWSAYSFVVVFAVILLGYHAMAGTPGGILEHTMSSASVQNYWINGNIIHPNSGGTGVQWFSFTANDITQHIYVKMSTITYLNVYLYDSAFNQIGENLNVQGTNSVGNALLSLKKGETYYLKVTGEYYNKYYTGSYWITFNDTGVEPQ